MVPNVSICFTVILVHILFKSVKFKYMFFCSFFTQINTTHNSLLNALMANRILIACWYKNIQPSNYKLSLELSHIVWTVNEAHLMG